MHEETPSEETMIDHKLAAQSRYVDSFCEDLHEVCALSGHLHEHKSTCFKYAPRKPQHCRFHLTHFVKLWQDTSADDGSSKMVEVAAARSQGPIGLLPPAPVMARTRGLLLGFNEVLGPTGKDPLLLVWPREGCRGPEFGRQAFFLPIFSWCSGRDEPRWDTKRSNQNCSVQPAGRSMLSSILVCIRCSFWYVTRTCID